MQSVLIQVAILPLGSAGWRLARAVPVGEGLLRLLGPVPLGEEWQFRPGEYVEYEDRKLSDGTHALVAVRSASRDPEFRRRRITYAVTGALAGGLFSFTYTGILYTHPWIQIATVLIGAGAFAVMSVRWGDRAWYELLVPWWSRWWEL